MVAIALPYSLRELLRALRRDERLCLFGCTLFWTESLMIGFLPFVAAVPAVLFGVALAVRQAEEPSRRRALVLGALAVTIFYLHLCGYVFFVAAAVLATALLPPPEDSEPVSVSWLLRRAKSVPRRMIWLVPSLLLVGTWFANSSVVHPDDVGWTKAREVEFDSLSTSVSSLNQSLLDIWKAPYDDVCALALAAATVVLIWPSRRASNDGAWRRGVAAVLVTVAMIFYLAFPDKIGWLAYLNDRFALFAALVAPAVLVSASRARTNAALALSASAAVGSGIVAFATFRQFDAEVGDFDAIIAAAKPGRRMLSLIIDRASSGPRHTPYTHFGAYYRARYGGLLEPSFATLPQSPLRYKAASAPPPTEPLRDGHPLDYNNALEGPYYDYLLVRGSPEELLKRPQFASGPRWYVVARDLHWALLDKTPASGGGSKVAP